MTAKGSYVLVVRLDQAKPISVGKLGQQEFPRGYYLYFGSALNGLEGRIQRHLRSSKILKWHIDYLTTVASVTEVWRISDETRWECVWAQLALDQDEVTAPAKGFGSSDCKCYTHLIHVTSRKKVDGIRRLLRRNGGDGNHGLNIRRTVL